MPSETSSADAATLSSAASLLDDLVARVVEVADHYQEGSRQEVVAHQLHEVERALRQAARQLETARRTLGR
jgi:hypothetical protein